MRAVAVAKRARPSFLGAAPLPRRACAPLPLHRAMGTVPGASFDTVCLHGGFDGDAATTARGVPVHRTAPFIFKDTDLAVERPAGPKLRRST